MDTRHRPKTKQKAPVGLASSARVVSSVASSALSSMNNVPSWPQRLSFCPPGFALDQAGDCVSTVCEPQAHPLADLDQNARLAEYERRVKDRFAGIVPTLKHIASLQQTGDFAERAQAIARERMGFDLDESVLANTWIAPLDMRRLYGQSVLQTFCRLAQEEVRETEGCDETEAAVRFFIECGFHEVNVSACADGRLKGFINYILRLPQEAVPRHQFYAGTTFDVELNVKQWTTTELRRFREGVPTTADSGTRYLKIASYHFSGSDPDHEGCAAHGSSNAKAMQAALDRLQAFSTAIENGFCCGASVATLLIGVDTDNDSIRVHVPDANGEISLDCFIDNSALYQETAKLTKLEAQWKLNAIVEETVRNFNRTVPEIGMRRLIKQLLTNNLSQIDYVCEFHNGRYADIGHAERFISVGDGFEEVHLRNLAYFSHMQTLEEGTADMDVGIKIFTRLNVAQGLPVPVAIHYRYDDQVPGARDRAVARCQRVKAAIMARYPELAHDGLLICGMSVQAHTAGSALEKVSDNDQYKQGH
ncbi:MAG TPA: carboxysome shell carbonic anhydrase [Halothiobacillus sp.]|nr:carboxysome shell carbonic anhydrase [Halothiobacillus sp.]